MAEPDPTKDPRKYIRLAAELRSKINDGTLAPGDRTPSRVDLAAQTGWSPLTCAKSLRVLAGEGLVTWYKGIGYVVNYPSVEEPATTN
jgi:DNA-binding GntR family transcriptional regulator